MTPLDILSHFLSFRFPLWGACNLTFFPNGNMLRVDCASEDSWLAILRDMKTLQVLDIGVDSVVAIRPDRSALVIEMASTQVQ